MLKKTISIVLALVTVLSAISALSFTAYADELNGEAMATADEATKDEATFDEAKLVMSSEPKVDASSVNGTVIGYMGDANLDGKINIKDCTTIQKHVAKIIILNEQAKALSDVYNNGSINVKDATSVQKYIAGIKSDNSVVWHLLYETGTHKHNYVVTEFEVTCTMDGYTSKSCVCGDEIKENIVKAQGHQYKKEMVYATCNKEGYTVNTCRVCGDNFKSDYKPATNAHKYNRNAECSVCGDINYDYTYKAMKDFVKSKGEYIKTSNGYYYQLDTGYESEAAAVIYAEDALGLMFASYFEEGVDMITVVMFPEKNKFEFYMICQGVYECVGTYDMSKYTVHVKDIKDIEYYFYDNTVKEKDCLNYTLEFLDAVLAVYTENQRELPANIQGLGFKNFVVQ